MATKYNKSMEHKHDVCMTDIKEHLVHHDDIKEHLMHHDKQYAQQTFYWDGQLKQNELFKRTMMRTKDEVMMVHSTVNIHEEKIDTTWTTVLMLSEKVKDLQKIVLDMKQKDVLSSSFFKEC